MLNFGIYLSDDLINTILELQLKITEFEKRVLLLEEKFIQDKKERVG